MSDALGSMISPRIVRMHEMILATITDLADEQLAQAPGPTAPPVGWHLWHVSRWADRLQASFAPEARDHSPLPLSPQIWIRESLVERWGLDPAALGLLQAGPGMEVKDAVALAQVGKHMLLDYAQRAFAAVEQAIADIDGTQLLQPRRSIMEFRIEGHTICQAPGAETTLGADLLFHLAHGSRHLGMMEALRGALWDMQGTASV